MALPRFRFLALFLVVTVASSTAYSQQLTDNGILATGVMSRSRVNADDFQLGDMMYVTALHPANSGGMYLSAHMQYRDEQNNWQPIPTANSDLGNSYKSTRYSGVRDYVYFPGDNRSVTRHICLFIPYDAAGLDSGRQYVRRYVIRLWDKGNNEIANVALPGESVSTSRNSDNELVITKITAKACSSLADPSLKPVPESENVGSVQFFNTKNGGFFCLGTK